MKTNIDCLLNPELHEHYYMNPGEQVEDDYKEHFDKNGVRILKKDGKRNTYDEIQSYAESCDINVIMKRYINGDFTVFDKNNPQYIDCTVFPETYAEWFELGQKAQRYFNELDPEIRSKFNNSFEQFLSQAELRKVVDKVPEEVDYKGDFLKEGGNVNES